MFIIVKDVHLELLCTGQFNRPRIFKRVFRLYIVLFIQQCNLNVAEIKIGITAVQGGYFERFLPTQTFYKISTSNSILIFFIGFA